MMIMILKNCCGTKPSYLETYSIFFFCVHLSPSTSHFSSSPLQQKDELHFGSKCHLYSRQIILNKYEKLSPQQPIFICSCISIKLALA